MAALCYRLVREKIYELLCHLICCMIRLALHSNWFCLNYSNFADFAEIKLVQTGDGFEIYISLSWTALNIEILSVA